MPKRRRDPTEFCYITLYGGQWDGVKLRIPFDLAAPDEIILRNTSARAEVASPISPTGVAPIDAPREAVYRKRVSGRLALDALVHTRYDLAPVSELAEINRRHAAELLAREEAMVKLEAKVRELAGKAARKNAGGKAARERRPKKG